MRQGQQHRRGRTRGGQNNNHGNQSPSNNNRKGQNPISRTYQSNGPDGKVSGTASGIAEKYLSMARDATTSGDPVLAENYLQHAEHYNRIILAYRESQAQGGEDGNGQRQRSGQPGDSSDTMDDQGEDDGETYGRDMQPLPPVDLPQRQPEQRQPEPRQNDQRQSEPRQNEQPQRGFDSPRSDNNRSFDDRQPRFNDGQQRRNNQPRDRYQGQGERFNNGDRAPDRQQDRQNGNDRNNGQRGDRFGNDRNQSDRQPFGERQPRDQTIHDRPPLDRQAQDRPVQDRPVQDRQNERSFRDNGQPRLDQRPEVRPEPRPDFMRPEPRPEPRADLPIREIVRPDPSFLDIARPDVPVAGEQPIAQRPEPAVRAPRAPRRERAPAAVVGEHEQPEFLRRPVVRRPRRDPTAIEDAPPPIPTGEREPDQD